jgi:hypothetical protein
MAHMFLYRLVADVEPPCDLFVRHPLAEPGDDLLLSIGQVLQGPQDNLFEGHLGIDLREG